MMTMMIYDWQTGHSLHISKQVKMFKVSPFFGSLVEKGLTLVQGEFWQSGQTSNRIMLLFHCVLFNLLAVWPFNSRCSCAE